MKNIEVDYEGMGTNIEASIKSEGEIICVIGAYGNHNGVTQKIVNAAKEICKQYRKRKPKEQAAHNDHT